MKYVRNGICLLLSLTMVLSSAATACAELVKSGEATGILDEQALTERVESIIDELGLDPADRNMLTLMYEKYGDRPVGLNTIAALTGDEASTIEDYLEPFLVQLGMIQRTPRGRVVTELAKKHLGL